MIKVKENVFLQILRSALWNHTMDASSISGEELAEMIKLSYEQSVAGVTLDYLMNQNNMMQQEMLYQSIGDIVTIKNQNSKINYELKKFVDLLDKKDIPYVVVKGQVAAQWYDNPQLRQSGDIDVFVSHEYYEMAQQCIQDKYHVKLEMDVFEKHSEFIVNGVIFELHYDLVQFSNKKSQKKWEYLLKTDKASFIEIEGMKIRTLSPTLNVLYIFIHLFLHLIQSGIGLRQVCDLAMCLDYYKCDVDKDILEEELDVLGLKKAFLSIGAILVEGLGLPNHLFPFSIGDKHKRLGRKILNDMIRTGTFGQNVNLIKNKGLFRSIQTGMRIFYQSCKFVGLAPKEVVPRFPMMVMSFMGMTRMTR